MVFFQPVADETTVPDSIIQGNDNYICQLVMQGAPVQRLNAAIIQPRLRFYLFIIY